jgi:glycine oxidase
MRPYANPSGMVSRPSPGSGLFSQNVMATAVPLRNPSPDVVVVGGGVIGLSVAARTVAAGSRVLVLDPDLPGAASGVAAGLLAPSLGSLPPAAAHAFRDATRRYPDFLAAVAGRSGRPISAGQGILEIALSGPDLDDLNEADDPAAVTRTEAEISAVAPELVAAGGVFHPNDGWIDPRSLLEALRLALPAGAIRAERVTAIESGNSAIRVRTGSGEVVDCGHVVISAGSWSPTIDGLATRLPITPARGQVLAIETDHRLPFAIACRDGYLVPRTGGIVIGSTFELVGFDARATDSGRSSLEALARRIVPGPLSRATTRLSWAGLRPMTPDKLPIIDAEPTDRRIVYASGHGKNGLLLAGLTAEIVLDLIAGNLLELDSPFRLDRFKMR